MRQRGFAQIVLIIILLLLVGGGAYYFGIQKGKIFPIPTQTPTEVITNSTVQITPTINPTSSPITSWNTYTNTRYNYSIKYPTNWYIDNNNSSFDISNTNSISIRNYTDTGNVSTNFGLEFAVWKDNVQGNNNLVNLVNTELSSTTAGKPESTTNTTIAGYPGLIAHYTSDYNLYFFVANKYLFEASFGPTASQTNQQYFDQILSTLKFIR